MEARLVQDDGDLLQVLELQRENLARNLSATEALSDGFVTVEHTLDTLRRMHAVAPSVIAKDAGALAGYALVMPVECRAFVPVLEPMFERIASIEDGGRPLAGRRFYVMGQICVAKPWRGRGVFDLLYEAHRRLLGDRYECVVTEVAARNVRSLGAHRRIGFRTIDRYRDGAEEWALVVWDWSMGD